MRRSGSAGAGRYCSVAAGVVEEWAGAFPWETVSVLAVFGARSAALGGLGHHRVGTAAAETVVLTTSMPCVVSLHRWMLALAPSRCRRSRRHPSPFEETKRCVATTPSWCAQRRVPEPASLCFPSRLLLANTVALPVVLRSLARYVAARLWSALQAWRCLRRRRSVQYRRWTCKAAALGHPDTAIAVAVSCQRLCW